MDSRTHQWEINGPQIIDLICDAVRMSVAYFFFIFYFLKIPLVLDKAVALDDRIIWSFCIDTWRVEKDWYTLVVIKRFSGTNTWHNKRRSARNVAK